MSDTAPLDPIPLDPIMVSDDGELAELCRRWRGQAALAVDTEFQRTDTFYPIAGLIQVGDGQGCYLVDPLAIGDLTPLRDVMLDESVTKVLHACSEDLEVFQRLLGAVPSPVLDTQLAAAFCGYGFSLSYAALVDAVLGVHVAKGETRSDWLRRPLSESQKKYAALDVAHLLVVYGTLRRELSEQQRLDWVAQDCAEMVANARRTIEPGDYYLKVRNAWRLDRPALAVLQALCHWRELQARERDLPRNRLIKEAVLIEMASRQPDSIEALRQIPGIAGRTWHDEGETLLALIAGALDSDPADWPEPLPPPLTRSQGDQLKTLKNYVRGRAQQLQIPRELLVRKKDYEALIRSGERGDYSLPERLQTGWRGELLGQALLQRAREFGRPQEPES